MGEHNYTETHIHSERKINIEEARKLLSYNRDTGVFTWVFKPSKKVCAGSVAGCVDSKGYRVISIKKIGYFAHRLAWAFENSVWPSLYIDHINGDRLDNRISNLRLATNSENQHNQKGHRSGDIKGCHFVKSRNEWIGKIMCRGKSVHLGYHKTFEEAHAMYLLARNGLYLYAGCQRKFREDIFKLGIR